MTIDERLDRLTERHEALTMTVELLAADIRQMAARNEQEHQRVREEMQARDKRIDKLFEEMLLAMARLANTAQAHEARISRLEDR